MKGGGIVRAVAILIGLLFSFLPAVSRVNVVATSAVLADIARQVGGEAVEVTTIIPAGFCPAHYDLRPSDILAVSRAQLVLYHGIEPWLETLLGSVNRGARAVAVKGPWNTPPALTARAADVAAALKEIAPDKADYFAAREGDYAARIASLGEELSSRAAELALSQVAAVVMLWQADFARWLGLQVVATYPPEERLSLKDLAQLVSLGKEKGARLVIDNLQSGVSFGARLAHELAAVHVVLTNFPGALPGAVDLLSMLEVNAQQVFSAAAELSR